MRRASASAEKFIERWIYMNYKMHLTPEEEEILNGGKGETMAKVMKTLVMYGDAFGATKMCLSQARWVTLLQASVSESCACL